MIESLRACLNALTDEVRVLKASVAALQNQKEPLARGTAENPPHSESGEPWSTAVQGWKHRGRKSNRRNNCNKNQLSQRTQSSDLQPRTSHAQEERGPSTQPQASRGKNRGRVVGARKIWGTLKNSSVSSIKSVISRLCNIDGGLRVRRKDQEGSMTKRSRWWYVVHGNEPLLNQLETKWDQVKLQTSWKLEPCFMHESSTIWPAQNNPPPVDNTTTGNVSDSQPALNDNTAVSSLPRESVVAEISQSVSQVRSDIKQPVSSDLTSGTDHSLLKRVDNHPQTL